MSEPIGALLFGATASGKTALALALAARLPLEIISADSRQVYRHLEIGTAKPTAAERQAVPHHLVDILELDETYNAARFASDALRFCGEIRGRGRIPLIVGGAGFYLKVLREGLFESPVSEAEVQRIRREVLSRSDDSIRDELARRDPERLAQIHPNDRYRLSRALEICITSGRSVTELTAERAQSRHTFLEFRMVVPRSLLHARIAMRTDAMLALGWRAEVQAVLETHAPDTVGLTTLGYPHVVDALAGRIDESTLRERIIRDTRRYARHQEVWFRKWTWAQTLPVGGIDAAADLQANLATMEPALRAAFPHESS